MDEVLHRAKKIVMRSTDSPPKRKQTSFSTTEKSIGGEGGVKQQQLREENESLKAELLKMKNELKIKECTLTELKEKLHMDPKTTIDQRIIQLQQKLSYAESRRKHLEHENLISSQMIRSQKALICQLESETSRTNELYAKLVDAQRSLIALLETKYNELLHSLIDSFDDIDTPGGSYETKVEEIQSDLNSLIQILGYHLKENEDAAAEATTTAAMLRIADGDKKSFLLRSSSTSTSSSSSMSIERPLGGGFDSNRSPIDSIRSMRMMLHSDEQFLAAESKDSTYSDLSWSQAHDESVYIDVIKEEDLNDFIQLYKYNKCDFACQCRLDDEENYKNTHTIKNEQSIAQQRLNDHINHADTIGLSNTDKSSSCEIDRLRDLLHNYLNLIRGYKQLIDQKNLN